MEDITKHVPVLEDSDEWNAWKDRKEPVLHIELGNRGDMILISPLVENSLGKIACGTCDNLLLCVVVWDRLKKPLLFCPTMNTRTYDRPITSELITKLKTWKYKEVSCVSKLLMCGDRGLGALAEVSIIF